MRTDEAFYNISMYLYNKNVLEYAQIARNETESKNLNIEGCSTIYCQGTCAKKCSNILVCCIYFYYM